MQGEKVWLVMPVTIVVILNCQTRHQTRVQEVYIHTLRRDFHPECPSRAENRPPDAQASETVDSFQSLRHSEADRNKNASNTCSLLVDEMLSKFDDCIYLSRYNLKD
jgi:hypothetical protein